MLGSIFGDIAGSIYEFNNIKTTDFDLFNPAMTYTDDSILTIAVADWLLMGTLSSERLINTIKNYVRRYPNPMGGYGIRFNSWAKSENSEPYNSWGNGSAMRVSPVGWAFDTLEQTEEIARLTAEITHNHPEGIKGAQATAAAIYMARNLYTKAQIKEYIENKYGYNLSRTCDQIRPYYSFNESCQETVPEAIIAFMDSSDFESAIRLAVSLGGDSDTLACITGGIAEAFYGMRNTLPDQTNDDRYNKIEITEYTLKKLPQDLKQVVEDFNEKVISKNKRFRGKNEATTISGSQHWMKIQMDDKILDEDSYKIFIKGFEPEWDSRFGVYYEDGWCYIYRSSFLLKKFKFEKRDDGNYHLNTDEVYTLESHPEDQIDEVLYYGYFDFPFRYKERVCRLK